MEVVTRVSGPEPGYLATAILITQIALTLLEEGDKLPGRGGVFTVGSLLGDTSIVQRLHGAGILFDVVSVSLRQGRGAFEPIQRHKAGDPLLGLSKVSAAF